MSRAIAWKSSRFVTEELLNQWTHGIGFALSLPAGWWLLQSAAERRHVGFLIACAVYSVTMSLLYACSTLSHSVLRGVWRHRFRTLDQICIFLFMAGCYTPFGIAFPGTRGESAFLILMWLMAIVGISLKVFYTRHHSVAVWFYFLMGWLPVLLVSHFVNCVGGFGVVWIAAGGLAYCVGMWFLANDERPLFHPAWHVCVMIGTVCHYVLIVRYIVPCV